jgi:muramoyltetrapeptide carboxypeptidase
MPYLNHIHLIAPSYPILEEDVNRAKSYFETLGMQVTLPLNLLGEDLLCANTDEMRLTHLQRALDDPSADIIWLLYGGYGLTRLIPHLFQREKPKKEKLFIGYSDGTALHVFLNQIWNWRSLHGSGALQVVKKTVGAQTIEATVYMAREGLSHYIPPILKPFNTQAREMSSLSGKLIGGNLCILQCSIGSSWQLNPSGKILFLEDVDERGYRIDRMLMHLQQANLLEDVKAIIFGDFVKGIEPNGTSLVLPVLQRFAENVSLPVFYLPGCGHGDENFPLPFNVDVTFPVEEAL